MYLKKRDYKIFFVFLIIIIFLCSILLYLLITDYLFKKHIVDKIIQDSP